MGGQERPLATPSPVVVAATAAPSEREPLAVAKPAKPANATCAPSVNSGHPYARQFSMVTHYVKLEDAVTALVEKRPFSLILPANFSILHWVKPQRARRAQRENAKISALVAVNA